MRWMRVVNETLDPTQFDNSWTAEGKQCGPPVHNGIQFCPLLYYSKEDNVKNDL